MIPFFILYRKKKKRVAKFESQLPDALDLIARALKAGHAFSTGMRMVANEFDDPLGTEFGRTIDEISFGMELDQALKNLLKRVDCNDLKFFVMSLILHREAGGNLAEILGNISRLIRERFRLMRKVRVLSAQGRMSAYRPDWPPLFRWPDCFHNGPILPCRFIYRPNWAGYDGDGRHYDAPRDHGHSKNNRHQSVEMVMSEIPLILILVFIGVLLFLLSAYFIITFRQEKQQLIGRLTEYGEDTDQKMADDSSVPSFQE